VEPRGIEGWGVDPQPARPGVPMEREPRRRRPAIVRQALPRGPQPTRRVELARLTPVFGTAQLPHGLSGLLRRQAYRIPEHKPPHFLLLLIADRVDVLGSALGRLVRRVRQGWQARQARRERHA
jgi:hypothetical protein